MRVTGALYARWDLTRDLSSRAKMYKPVMFRIMHQCSITVCPHSEESEEVRDLSSRAKMYKPEMFRIMLHHCLASLRRI